MRAFLFSLFLGLLLFSPGVAAAQNPTPTPAPENEQVVKNQVEKTYCTLAVGAETVQALKDDLLLNAKRMAVNELFGEMIAAVTETENFVVTRDQVRALSTGYVRIRSSRYFNGENFAEACVTIQAYVTDEDRAQFRPVQLEKRYCGTDPNMTVAQIRAHTQEEAIVQLLSEYDRRLAEVDRNILLRLLRRVQYPESGFVPGTESYCVTVQGEVIPVEVLALLEGGPEAIIVPTSVTTPRPTQTPRPTPGPRSTPTGGERPQTLSPSVESPHPYPNYYDEGWLISNNDASAQATRLHFARLELEENVDWLILMDARDVEIQRLTGFYPEGVWSEPIPGNLVKIRLVTDGSVRHWGFALDAVETVPYATLAYSPHPYPNYANLEWRFDNLDPDAEGTRLHFSRIELEENVDWLVIMDITETPYQWITGDHPNGLWTIGVPGNGVIVRLISDSSVRKWGFNLDALESAEPEEVQPRPEPEKALAESEHPYKDNTNQIWTLVNPNPAAAFSKVHFTRLDLNDGDTLVLMDGENNHIQTFGGGTHLRDFWSDDIPGRVIKIQMHSDGGRVDWGFRIDRLVDGENQPALAESPHWYPNDWTETWTLVNPNPAAAFSKVHFTRLDLNDGDTLVLMDGENNHIQTFGGGTHLRDFWSDDIPGRVIKIQMHSDGGRVDWGFRIDRLVDGENQPALAESPHWYPNDWTETWTLVNPNPAAAFSKVHFTRLDLNNDDTLVLMDGENNHIQTFGGGTHLRDFWSDDIPGRVIKIQMHSDGGRVDWGFRIDDIAPKADETPIPAFVNAVYVRVGQPGDLWLNNTLLGRASQPGEYRVWLPQLGENLLQVQTLFHQQDILLKTNKDGSVHIEYKGIQPKPK